MSDHPRRTTKITSRKKLLLGIIGATALIVAFVLVITTTDQSLSPEELAARWVDDNVDALSEEIAGYLSGQNPVLREVGGELLEDRIHTVIEWQYSQPLEIQPKGNGLYEINATASAVFDLNLPMGPGHIDAAVPFVLRVNQPEQAVADSKLNPIEARVNIDLPGVPDVPTAIAGRAKTEAADLVTKVHKSGVVELAKNKVSDMIPGTSTPALKLKVASASSLPPTPQREATTVLAAEVDPDHAACIAAAREAGDRYIDSIRLETIETSDPPTLTDTQRGNWRDFFKERASQLMTVCVTLWSEPITQENADLRNEDYRGSNDKNGCVANVEQSIREDAVDDRAKWEDTHELLVRPYLSLTIAERMVLREQLDNISYCVEFYPQLFTGRWVPMSK